VTTASDTRPKHSLETVEGTRMTLPDINYLPPGENLWAYRNRGGLTQEALSRRASLHRNFVPPVVFPNLIIWLWAGVVWVGRVPAPRTERINAPQTLSVAQAHP
jgi:hypothetical protein